MDLMYKVSTSSLVAFRVFIVPVYLVYWLWICVPQTPTKFSPVHWLHLSILKALVICLHGRYQLQHLLYDVDPCVLLGGADKNVVVFDKNEEQIVATLKGHTKKVTSVIYHPSQVTLSDNQIMCNFTKKSKDKYVSQYIWRHAQLIPILIHCLLYFPSLTPLLSFLPLVCGLLCISRHHHPCVVRHWRQLCPGGACPWGRRHWAFPTRYWRLPAQLLWGSGVCGALRIFFQSPCLK